MAVLLMLGGALYRFDTYLVAFDPGPHWSYFPSLAELLITAGFVATEVLVYVAVVKRFPILMGSRDEAPAPLAARRSVP
jgi:Ni/Fe-hydrogenase subunit HybB-like protein